MCPSFSQDANPFLTAIAIWTTWSRTYQQQEEHVTQQSTHFFTWAMGFLLSSSLLFSPSSLVFVGDIYSWDPSFVIATQNFLCPLLAMRWLNPSLILLALGQSVFSSQILETKGVHILVTWGFIFPIAILFFFPFLFGVMGLMDVLRIHNGMDFTW